MHITNNRLRCVFAAWVTVVSLGMLSACKSPDVDPRAGTVDPNFYRTPEAAELQSRNARFMFHLTLIEFMTKSGTLADEFFYIPGSGDGISVYSGGTVLDSRFLPDETKIRSSIAGAYSIIGNVPVTQTSNTPLYSAMHKTRNGASLARQALKAYAPDSPLVLQGEMAAYEGYMMVMLADLYCSGIPLSTLLLEDDFVYQAGSTTQQVYEKAIAVFDTAIALAGSDASIRHLASIGKGRALLALGRYAEAASSVQDIPIGYVFDLPVTLRWRLPSGDSGGIFWTNFFSTATNTSNTEGGNGINFRNSGDPRVDSMLTPITPGATIRRPKQLERVKIATYIEAQLIRAEALAQAGDAQYLTILNNLRANASGMAPLAPLTEPTVDPGETVLNARIDLIFEERAKWLFFTGHRQGDLRRLVRHYDRLIENTYPTGIYPTGSGSYSNFIDIPIPTSELPNTLFDGCIARGA